MSARHAARRIGQRIKRLLGKHERRTLYEPDPQRLCEHLSGITGSSPVWCGSCGHLLSAIVSGDSTQTEVVALACFDCLGTVPVRGVLAAGEADPRHSIH